MILIREHGLDVTSDETQEDGDTETGRDQVEESRLSMLVDMHHEDGHQETRQVR